MKGGSELELIMKMVREGKITTEEADELMDAVVEEDFSDREEEYEYMARKAEQAFNDTMAGRFNIDGVDDFDDEEGNRKTSFPDNEGAATTEIFEFNINSESDIYVRGNHRIGVIGQKSNTEKESQSKEIRNDSAIIKIVISEEDRGRLESLVDIKSSVSGIQVEVNPEYEKPVGIDIILPDRKFNGIVANSSNGNVFFKGICSNYLEVQTTNGRVHGLFSQADETRISTTNGKILIEECGGDNMVVFTTNARVLITGCGFNDLIKADTTNGGVGVIGSESANIIMNGSNGSMSLENNRLNNCRIKTSNGRIFIKSNMVYDDRVVDIEGMTTSGNITVFAEHHMGAGFEADAGEKGNIQLGKYFKPASQKRGGGNMYYAEGESRDGRRANRYTELKLITGKGDISIDWD